MTFDRFDVVVVPFPFTDRDVKLRRPAVVLSDERFSKATGQSLLAMVTRAERSSWPGDLLVSDTDSAGLRGRSIVRLKLFTLVDGLISRKLGTLARADSTALANELATHIGVPGR